MKAGPTRGTKFGEGGWANAGSTLIPTIRTTTVNSKSMRHIMRYPLSAKGEARGSPAALYNEGSVTMVGAGG